MSGLTHFDREGRAVMVDVSGKEETARVAVAGGSIIMQKATLDLITAATVASPSQCRRA